VLIANERDERLVRITTIVERLGHANSCARVHLEAVRKTAHQALVELRRLVGVLREAEPVYEPPGGLGRLDELIEIESIDIETLERAAEEARA
jgi:hypothetical protein